MILKRWYRQASGRDVYQAGDVRPKEVFALELLERAEWPLTYDGSVIRLSVDNGSWLWRVDEVDRVAGVVRASWPD